MAIRSSQVERWKEMPFMLVLLVLVGCRAYTKRKKSVDKFISAARM